MAALPFSTSQPRNPETRKHFTLQQANRSLPLVSRIVRDIVNSHERAAQLQGKLEIASEREAGMLRDQLEVALTRLQTYVDELESIGVELKDYEMGLIDFPGRHQGREICLCWKLGEEKVAWWHELHTGYVGRRPATMLDENE